MKKYLNLMMVFLVLGCSSAFAKTAKCRIDKETVEGIQIDVPLDSTQTNFQENIVSAYYHQGDDFDQQTYLQMNFNGFISRNYNVCEHTIYVLTHGDYRFQCWFE